MGERIVIHDQLDRDGDGFTIEYAPWDETYRITYFHNCHWSGDVTLTKEQMLMKN